MWYEGKISQLLKIKYPIIQAPMAGGATTPELIAAVSNFGGLGSLGAGYLSPQKLQEDIDKIKQLTAKPFMVNLFVPEPHQIDPNKLDIMQNKLQGHFAKFGVTAPKLSAPFYQDIAEQVAVLIESKVPIVSFTFGIPDDALLNKLSKAGTTLIATATSVKEAVLIQRRGFAAVVAQGYEAGGHRGTFVSDDSQSCIGTMALIPQLVDQLDIPVIAAGGIMDSRGIAAALCLGATGVQMGTVFLSCHEAGIADCYKKRLLHTTVDDATVLTKSFTGRFARGLRNELAQALHEHAEDLLDFPIQGALTSPLRQAASKASDTEFMSLWAGQGVGLAQDLSAQDLMQQLVAGVK